MSPGIVVWFQLLTTTFNTCPAQRAYTQRRGAKPLGVVSSNISS